MPPRRTTRKRHGSLGRRCPEKYGGRISAVQPTEIRNWGWNFPGEVRSVVPGKLGDQKREQWEILCKSRHPYPSTFPTGWLLRLCKSDAIGHTPCDAPVSILIVGLSVHYPKWPVRSSTCGWDQWPVRIPWRRFDARDLGRLGWPRQPGQEPAQGTNRAVGIMLERPQDLFAGMETPRIHASRRCLTSQSQDREFSFLRFRHLPETTGDRGLLVPAGVGPDPSGMPTAMFLVLDFT